MCTVSSDHVPSLLITVSLYLHVFIFLTCFLQWYIHITSIELLQPSPTWGKQHKINKHRKIKPPPPPQTKNPWWYLFAPSMLRRNFNWWESSNREMCLASSQWNTYSFNAVIIKLPPVSPVYCQLVLMRSGMFWVVWLKTLICFWI